MNLPLKDKVTYIYAKSKGRVKTEGKRHTARRGKKFRYGNVTRQVTPAAVGAGGHAHNEVAAAQGLVSLSEEQLKYGYIRNLRKRPGDIIIEQPVNEVNLDDLGEGQEGSEDVSPKLKEIPPKRQKLEVAQAEPVVQESPK